MYFENRYYKSEEDYLLALADAMREEYKAIVDAGFVLQVDDPRLIRTGTACPSCLCRQTGNSWSCASRR